MGTNRDSVQTACNRVFERHWFRLRGIEPVTDVTTVLGIELQDGWTQSEASMVSFFSRGVGETRVASFSDHGQCHDTVGHFFAASVGAEFL